MDKAVCFKILQYKVIAGRFHHLGRMEMEAMEKGQMQILIYEAVKLQMLELLMPILPQCKFCKCKQIVHNYLLQQYKPKKIQEGTDQIEKILPKQNVQSAHDQNLRVEKMQYEQISQGQNQILNPINPQSANYERFKILGNTIQIIKGGGYFQLLGKVTIAQKNINKFKIIHTSKGMIKIAIVDQKYIRERDAFNKKQCFYYSVKSGIAWESGLTKVQGIPSKEGDEIVMEVKKGEITWKVGEQTRAKIQSPLLNSSSIKWVPFIAMFDKGDIIKWIL